MRWLLALLLSLALAGEARAQSCTDGTDCFCDCVENTDGAGNDVGSYANTACQTIGTPKQSGVAYCEDGEAETLYDGIAAEGNGAPNYGPWFDPTGGATPPPTRYYFGSNSYWYKKYGSAGAMQIPDGSPSPAGRYGDTCDTNSGSPCFGGNEFCGEAQGDAIDGLGADCWGTNTAACIDVMRALDFTNGTDDEGAIPAKPDGTRALYGNQVLAGRIKAFECGFLTDGVSGEGIVSTAEVSGDDEVCLTEIVAYSDNNNTALAGGNTIWDPNAWKHDECGVGGLSHGWPMFGQRGTGGCDDTMDPFCAIMWPNSGSTLAALNSAITMHTGTKTQGSALMILKPANYDATTDWPDKNEWALVRAKIDGLTGSDARFTTYVTIGNNAEVTVMDFTIANYATHLAPFFPCNLNTYSNTAAGADFNEAVRIFKENHLWVAGSSCTPLTAAEAAFDSSGDPPATGTAAGRGVTIRGGRM